MTRLLSCLLLFAVSMAAGAQTQRYDLRFTLSDRNFADTLAIEYEQDQIFLPVEINGRKYRFKLDTGSSKGVVYSDTPIRGMRELGEMNSFDATGAASKVRVVGLPDIRIGHLTLSNYTACVHQRIVPRKNEDGIIGFDLINKGIIAKIDVRNRRMILTDRPRLFWREPGEGLKYRLRLHVPYIKVAPFEQQTEEVLFDTGSRSFYAMSRQDFDKYEKKGTDMADAIEGRSTGSMAIGHFGAEQVAEVVSLRLDHFRWGGFEFSDLHCQTTQGDSHVGAPILRYGTVTINPLSKYVIFQAYDGATTCAVGNRPSDIAFIPVNGRPTVGLVREGSEPYQQGFRQGDIIEQIDGQRIPDFQSFVGYRFVAGQLYTFTLRDQQGAVRSIKAVMPTGKE